MPSLSVIVRAIFQLSVLLALPGGLWAAFEMYGLTLFRPQMLFFSIVHTMPLMVTAVLLSVPTGAAWLAQAALALVFKAYRTRLGLPRRPLVIFVVFIVAHAAALAGYDTWAWIALLRIPLCLLGLALTGLAVREAWRWLGPGSSGRRVAAAASDA